MKQSGDGFDRRKFLELVGVLGLTGFLSACRARTLSITPTLEELIAASTTPTPGRTANTPTTALDPSPDSGGQVAGGTATEAPGATATAESTQSPAYLSVAHGLDIPAVVNTALAALGGIEKFVKPGADVIIKPNICTNYYGYEYAATTNPEVVAALVRLSIGAGAKRVRVMDQPFGGSAESAYARSGIADAVSAAGGEMEIMNWNKYVTADIPDGQDLKQWVFYKPVLDADVFINVPIPKHHGLARLTLGGKNLLGVISNPAGIHQNYGQRIADLVSRVKPTLTVVDAIRILMENGPTGGNLDDVKKTDTIIASQDIVAADAYAASLFGLTGPDIAYIQAGANMGLGTMDLNSIRIEETNV